MSIIVSYGNYTHDAGEVEYAINTTAEVNQRGIPAKYRTTIDMQGLLLASSTTEMDQKVAALRAAYLKHDQDWTVNANGSPLDISIAAVDTIDGVTVAAPPSFPTNRGAAYITTLEYRIRLTYSQVIFAERYALKSFTESLTTSGGGYRRGFIETATGFPQEQLFRRHTVFRAVQQGQAVGFYETPLIPNPIWPAALVTPNPEQTLGSGVTLGPIGRPVTSDIPRSWKYQYESAVPLTGRPNIWGRTG